MAKRTAPQRVDEYVKKNPQVLEGLFLTEANQIVQLGSMIDIVCTAFAYGYMKGQKAKKGGAA